MFTGKQLKSRKKFFSNNWALDTWLRDIQPPPREPAREASSYKPLSLPATSFPMCGRAPWPQSSWKQSHQCNKSNLSWFETWRWLIHTVTHYLFLMERRGINTFLECQHSPCGSTVLPLSPSQAPGPWWAGKLELSTLPFYIMPLDSAALASPLPGQAGSGRGEEPTGEGDPPTRVSSSPGLLLLGCLKPTLLLSPFSA